jgi:hypothetical protein
MQHQGNKEAPGENSRPAGAVERWISICIYVNCIALVLANLD